MHKVADRIRREFGVYRAEQWPLFLHNHGLHYFEIDEPMPIDCYIWRDTVGIRAGIPSDRRAFLVWHECLHSMIHAGDQDWWLTRPQGEITVAKFERRADVLAALYPVWDPTILTNVLEYYDVRLPVDSAPCLLCT